MTGTLVQKVILEGDRAIGVRVHRRGHKQEILARKEVILSAGAFKSPHILQLSGIGDARHLESVGIETRHWLSGVGRNLQDRFLFPYVCTLSEGISLGKRIRPLISRAAILARYLSTRRGMGSLSHMATSCFLHTLDGLDRPDVELTLVPMIMDRRGGAYSIMDLEGYTINVNLVRSKHTGTVLARSANPAEAPCIDFNFPHDEDLATLRRGLEFCRSLRSTRALGSAIGRELMPGEMGIDDPVTMTRLVYNGYSGAGTCRMGREDDELAVVTPALRVRGLSGLRVADGSVMPQIVMGHTNLPCMTIGVMAADRILADS